VPELILTTRRAFRPYRTRTQRYAIMVAHRRCGKTVACVQDLLDQSTRLTRAHGRYAYVGPYLGQAKEVAWEYLKRFGESIIVDKNEGELWVETLQGHRIRIHGADNPDRLRGAYLDGVILDEYADMRPSIYGTVIRPMLADREGWATFIGTPKGRNEFHARWAAAENDPRWFRSMLRASATGLLKPAELDDARKEMTPEEYDQEFECSFDASIKGAYFGREIAALQEAGRITTVDRVSGWPLYTAWDIGVSASGMMAIWVFQVINGDVRVIDCYFNHTAGFQHYVDWLNARGYGGEEVTDWVPHDAAVFEPIAGRTRVEALAGMGRRLSMVSRTTVPDRINAAKMGLARTYFDYTRCAEGVEALRQYRTEWDEKRKAFADTPNRDWTTDIADAFTYLHVCAREMIKIATPEAKPVGIALSDLTMDEFHDLTGRHDRKDRV
jgi:phage terminase large subunit